MAANKNFKILVTVTGLPVDKLREFGTVVQWNELGNPTSQQLLELVKDCDALFCHGSNKIDKELLDAAPKLRVIGTYSVGYNHIDLEECKKRGVKVGYTPGETTEVAAEFGVGLLLATARRIPEANEASKDPINVRFHGYLMSGKQIMDTTVGFFGLGAIGSSMLEKLAPFKPARFIYHNRSRKENCPAEYVSFDELVKESDFLIVTAALTPETTGKFDKNVFAKMKKGAIFVNISRGPLVKTEDLYNALKSGHLEAAGLDVTDPEPLPKGHPLLALKNCIVTPHIASATYRARNRMNDLTISNIINGLTGKPMLAPLLDLKNGATSKIEIDETFLTARKSQRGRRVRHHGRWIFGGTERRSNCSFMVLVRRRRAVDLLSLIQRHIRPRTIIYSGWLMHRRVRHARNSVDPITRYHTQNIERKWEEFKSMIRAKKGIHDLQLKSHINKFMTRTLWRDG